MRTGCVLIDMLWACPNLQGDKVVKMNIDGVDASIAGIVECEVPAAWASLAVDTEARACLASNSRSLRFPRQCRLRNKVITDGLEEP